jgi:hypothetical protein
MKRPIPIHRMRIAWIVAAVADLVQVGLFPIFVAGGASPFDAALDVLVAAILSWLLGFHWAFAPSLVAELVPGLDLAPTWVLAVWIVTRGRPRGGARPEPQRSGDRDTRVPARIGDDREVSAPKDAPGPASGPPSVP